MDYIERSEYPLHDLSDGNKISYQLPEAPPPPDEPPPPEKPELPELHELPEPPDEIVKPPMDALPLVFRSL